MAEIVTRDWIEYLMTERVTRGERDPSAAAVDLAYGLVSKLQDGSVTAAEARNAVEVATGTSTAIETGATLPVGATLPPSPRRSPVLARSRATKPDLQRLETAQLDQADRWR